jgi:hypothetical protein
VRELLTDAVPPSESLLDSAMSELQAYHTSTRQRGQGPMVPRGGEWTDLFTMASGLYRFILPSHLTAHALLHCPHEGAGEGGEERARPRVYMFRWATYWRYGGHTACFWVESCVACQSRS